MATHIDDIRGRGESGIVEKVETTSRHFLEH